MMAFFLILIAFFALLYWWGVQQETKRREAVEKFCLARGYEFRPASQEFASSQWSSFPLFQRGHSKQMKNIGSGAGRDKSLTFFDYSFTVGHGKHRKHHLYFVVACFRESPLPTFTLGPENVFSKIAQAVGYHDIDFAHDPEFSKAYVLRGENEASIRAVFSPAVLSALKAEKGFYIEGNNDGLVCYCLPGKVEDLASLFQRQESILNLFPK